MRGGRRRENRGRDRRREGDNKGMLDRREKGGRDEEIGWERGTEEERNRKKDEIKKKESERMMKGMEAGRLEKYISD